MYPYTNMEGRPSQTETMAKTVYSAGAVMPTASQAMNNWPASKLFCNGIAEHHWQASHANVIDVKQVIRPKGRISRSKVDKQHVTEHKW